MDTSAFVAGFDPFLISEEQYTVPMVEEEFAGASMARMRFKTAIESGKLKIRLPDTVFVEKVKTSASAVGDFFFLSETDLQVLALALQLKVQGHMPIIATDDYSIQNVAKHLGIEFAPLATFGIRRQFKWVRYCPACRRKYPADYKLKICQVCGTELKRKPYKNIR
ncbi:MAG: ribonuclease VapC [Candidatus Bathyarchaeia archaeon]